MGLHVNLTLGLEKALITFFTFAEKKADGKSKRKCKFSEKNFSTTARFCFCIP